MAPEILEYIASQRVGVLAVEMMDGSPHGATVHFAHTEEPLMFLFETNRDYRKAEPLFGREVSRASLVIGADDNLKKTLQMDGNVRLIAPGEKELFEKVYLGKFPEKKEKFSGPKVVPFVFIPNWWRFTDWTKPEGKVIITS